MPSNGPTADRDSDAADSGRSFAAIDFETATGERSSACAVGAVLFEECSPARRIRLLIRPPDNCYDPLNTDIHGIGPSDTTNSPAFPEVWQQVSEILDGRLVVAHNTAFDISVLRRSAEHHAFAPDPFPFACTYRVARSALPDARSWKLDALARDFGIELLHHDPLSDAEAAGQLWMALPRSFGITPQELLERHGYRLGHYHSSRYESFSNAKPSSPGTTRSFSAKDFTPVAQPDPNGPLFAKKVVFTGTLECMPRREAFQAATDAGAVPVGSVNKKTDYLVIGTTDLRKVGESGRSSKHRKALALGASGSNIRIIDEDQFVCLLAGTVTSDTPTTLADNTTD